MSGERVFAIIGAIVVGAAIGYFGTVGALVVATGWCP